MYFKCQEAELQYALHIYTVLKQGILRMRCSVTTTTHMKVSAGHDTLFFRRRGQTAHALTHKLTLSQTHTHTYQKVPKLTYNHWTLRSINERNEFISGYLHHDVTSICHFVVDCVFCVIMFCVLLISTPTNAHT